MQIFLHILKWIQFCQVQRTIFQWKTKNSGFKRIHFSLGDTNPHFTLFIVPLRMVLLRVALFSLSLVVGKVASPMLLLKRLPLVPRLPHRGSLDLAPHDLLPPSGCWIWWFLTAVAIPSRQVGFFRTLTSPSVPDKFWEPAVQNKDTDLDWTYRKGGEEENRCFPWGCGTEWWTYCFQRAVSP